MTTNTETTTTRTCPPSAVADMIVPWFEVQEGEAVLYEGQFYQLARIGPCTPVPSRVRVHLVREGYWAYGTVNSHAYTAVRRYTEGISERDALVIAALDEAAENRTERASVHCQDCSEATLAAEEAGELDVFRAEDRDRFAGLCETHRNDLDMAEQYRAERDRREAGRG